MMSSTISGEKSMPPRFGRILRLGELVQDTGDHSDDVVAHIDHVERDQPRQDHRRDDDVHVHVEQNQDDVENRAHIDSSSGGDARTFTGSPSAKQARPGAILDSP
jgi:hypothetical protein